MSFERYLKTYYGKTWHQFGRMPIEKQVAIHAAWMNDRPSLSSIRRGGNLLLGIVALCAGLLLAVVTRGSWG